MKRLSFLLSLLLASTGLAESGEWKSLFNGTDLSGWVQRGGDANYEVIDGEIVGTTVPNTPNSFLCTEKDYGDFILELNFLCDPKLNSGVMVRAQLDPEKDRVNGFQIEIDPSDRGWTGGFYDEARRGWQNDLSDNPAARYAFKQNDWNHLRIELIGDSIRTFINGVPAAEHADSTDLSGFIGLQVHGVGKREDTLAVRFKDIRIQDLGQSHWKPFLKDGKLPGFTPTVEGTWSFQESGTLVGASPASEKRHSIMLSDEPFENFTLRTIYRANIGNSGLYFRTGRTDSALSVKGFQAEIDSEGTNAGGIYETSGRQWVAPPTPAETSKYFKKGDWNAMTVSAHGPHYSVHVNGTNTVKLTDTKSLQSGHIGFQLHGGEEMNIEVQSFDILETSAVRPIPELKPAAVELKIGEPTELATGFQFTEGPAVAPDGSIYFSDIPNDRIHRYDPSSGETTLYSEGNGNANGLMFSPAGALITCETSARQIGRHDLITNQRTALTNNFEGKKFNKPNDLALDGKGGVYFTDPVYGPVDTELPHEGVYYLPNNGETAQLIDATCTKPNGIAITKDGKTLYVVDNGAKKLIAYDILEEGYASTVTNRRILCNLESKAERAGDGMAIDSAGNLFVTVPEGIAVFSAAGKKIDHINFPQSPTNCKFGTGAQRTTLYVTARTGFYSVPVSTGGAR
jgi:sugar lactone lactonase YvrE